MLQGLGHDYQAHGSPIAQTDGVGAFSLALGNRLKAGANGLGHVAGIEQTNGDDHLNQLVEHKTFGHEQWEHRRRHKQHGNQWYRTEQFDECGAQHPDYRQPARIPDPPAGQTGCPGKEPASDTSWHPHGQLSRGLPVNHD